MKPTSKPLLIKAIVLVTALGVLTANSNIASAATKTITCYKGTTVKKVKTAKCPTGYSTKKPVAKPVVTKTATPVATKPAASGAIALSGTYKGVVTGTVTASDLQVSVDGDGTGNVFGLTQLTGTGSAAGCDSFSDSATLGSAPNVLKFELKSTSKACGDAGAGDKMVLTGDAIISGGTGKYVGATGTLKVSGSFVLKSVTEGSTFKSDFTATISGTINTK